MKQKRTFLVLILVVAILCLGIAYASISSVPLSISGTAVANSDKDNFVVQFTSDTVETTKSKDEIIVAGAASGLTADINCQNMTSKGDKVTLTYTIQNSSADLSADITATVKSTHTRFAVTHDWGETTKTLNKGETTTITVTVELLETVIDDGGSENVVVELTATPKQPTTQSGEQTA